MAIKNIVHCKRDKYDVYIGRPSKYGNPFIIGKHGTRVEVIEKFRTWLTTGKNFDNLEASKEKRAKIMQDVSELRGKILGCWCNFPKEDCHGRILHELATWDKIKDLISVPAQKIDKDGIPQINY